MQTKEKKLFIFAHNSGEAGSKLLYYLWNTAALLFSAAIITICSLNFGLGVEDAYIFPSFFRSPLLLLLNYLPVLILQILLDKLGWEGSAYMHLTDEVFERFSVISSKGFYVENGEFTTAPSEEGAALLHKLACVQYYMRDKSILNG